MSSEMFSRIYAEVSRRAAAARRRRLTVRISRAKVSHGERFLQRQLAFGHSGHRVTTHSRHNFNPVAPVPLARAVTNIRTLSRRCTMCGIAGVLDLRRAGRVGRDLVPDMVRALTHRGPDGVGFHHEADFACGTARLSIVDVGGGGQPLSNEDGSVVLVCNGEIFNHAELRASLVANGHRFRTRCDVEVLVHLDEAYQGPGFLKALHGQFAFALYDARRRRLLAARDHVGICPLHYAITDGFLTFASEIKAIVRNPEVPRTVDVRALDQVFSLPGIVSPRTILKHVKSLPAGHALVVEDGAVCCRPYWDFVFAQDTTRQSTVSEPEMLRRLDDLLHVSVARRLQGDVPVGVYLSGGLDSSLIAATVRELRPHDEIHSFSIAIEGEGFSERPHQNLVAGALGLCHHCAVFQPGEIADRLRRVVFHCECPLKELHNAGALALSEYTHAYGMKAVLSGQGADEFRKVKQRIYSTRLRASLGPLGCLDEPALAAGKLKGLHPINKRSYADCKLRLGDHLLADHGDRMGLANAVELRHPFLDQDLVEFAAAMPVDAKLRDYVEKYALKQIAAPRLPREIVERDKFGFAVPGTPALIRQNRKEIRELLSRDRLEAQGYFDPDGVARAIGRYAQPGFELNVPFDDDLLATVITFGLLVDLFELPPL